jgi:hypothetical protein
LVGAGGGASTVKVTSGVRFDTAPRERARAATRTSVPGAGSGVVSTTLSPGATSRQRRSATLSSGPPVTARSSSTCTAGSGKPIVVTVGAVKATSSCGPRWATRRPAVSCGVRG